MTVAFVLAGGGSLAAAQVGSLTALLEAGIRPDLVVGSSAGAINAYCFAQQPDADGVARLRRLWRDLHRRDVFPVDVLDIIGGLVGLRDGLVSAARLRRFLRRQLGTATLADTAVPAHVVATDLAAGESVVLSSGDAVTALLASSALPGVFAPVEMDGRRLSDGGITADTPVRQAEELGATVTYVLPAVGPTRESAVPHGAVPILLHSIGHLFGHAAETDVAAARGQVTVLPAPALAGSNPFDFRATNRLIELGHRAAADALDARPTAPVGGRKAAS